MVRRASLCSPCLFLLYPVPLTLQCILLFVLPSSLSPTSPYYTLPFPDLLRPTQSSPFLPCSDLLYPFVPCSNLLYRAPFFHPTYSITCPNHTSPCPTLSSLIHNCSNASCHALAMPYPSNFFFPMLDCYPSKSRGKSQVLSTSSLL